MTTDQLRKILLKVSLLEEDIEKLKLVLISLATQEYVSASLASGSGSKSYTRADYSKISDLISQMYKELASYKRLIKSSRKGLPTETIFLQGI